MSRTNSSRLRQPLGLVLVAGLVLSMGACDGGSASSASASAVQGTTTAPPDAPGGTPTGTPTDGATAPDSESATSSLTPLRAPVIARAVPNSLFGLHVLSGLFFPRITAGSALLWIAARHVWSSNYVKAGPNARYSGIAASHIICLLGWLGASVAGGLRLAGHVNF